MPRIEGEAQARVDIREFVEGLRLLQRRINKLGKLGKISAHAVGFMSKSLSEALSEGIEDADHDEA